MNQNEQENLNSTNETDTTENTETTENQEEVVIEETQDETEQVDVEALKKENATLKAQKEHWKAKANNVEVKPQVQAQARPQAKQDISSIDVISLIGAGVTESEDIQEVVDYAKFKKISVAEALKSSVVKTTIAEKKEQRATAQATNTGATRRSSSKVSDDTLVSKAQKGEIPDSDEDLARLIAARKGIK